MFQVPLPLPGSCLLCAETEGLPALVCQLSSPAELLPTAPETCRARGSRRLPRLHQAPAHPAKPAAAAAPAGTEILS